MEAVGAGPVGLDTCVFIYFIEENPRCFRLVQPLFEAVDRIRENKPPDRALGGHSHRSRAAAVLTVDSSQLTVG